MFRARRGRPSRTRTELTRINHQHPIPSTQGHTDAESSSGSSIRNGHDPGQLRLVDREMGAAGSLEALLVEDGFAGRGRERFCLDGPDGG